MSGAGLAASSGAAWQRFFYGKSDVDGRVLALLRIGFSALVLAHVVALYPNVGMLWSESGVLPLSDLPTVARGPVTTLLSSLSGWAAAPYVGFALLGFHALLLLVGYRARWQALFVFIWLACFQIRNPLVTNGQDALLRITAGLLVLLPIGRAWSLDARRGRSSWTVAPDALWPLRLLELQVSLVMLCAALWKVQGDDWTNGTALHYVTRLHGFWGNLPVPNAITGSEWLLAAGTYLTLSLELALPIAIWIPRLRRTALLFAVGFHLALAYTMNLFLFPWIMILGWCSFLRARDLDFAWRALTHSPLRLNRFPQLSSQRTRP